FTEILVGLLLVELRVALPRLVEADGRRERRGRPSARRGVRRGEVVLVLVWVYERRVCCLHVGGLVPARVASILAEDLLGHIGRERPPVDDERAHVSLRRDFGGDGVQDSRLRPAVAVKDDDVSESVSRQALHDLFDEGTVGRFGYLERAGVRLHAARDAV